jgi:hypothetical protein
MVQKRWLFMLVRRQSRILNFTFRSFVWLFLYLRRWKRPANNKFRGEPWWIESIPTIIKVRDVRHSSLVSVSAIWSTYHIAFLCSPWGSPKRSGVSWTRRRRKWKTTLHRSSVKDDMYSSYATIIYDARQFVCSYPASEGFLSTTGASNKLRINRVSILPSCLWTTLWKRTGYKTPELL